jgi:MFS family permease|tara:strand:- start:206 stop:1414 length:1209 start_codon:yes stop_codon:yes gene_type:complete
MVLEKILDAGPQALVMTATQRRWSLAAIILHMLAIGVALGIGFPLTTLVLDSWGIEAWLIGLVATMPSIGMLVFIPLMPRLIAGLGMLPSMYLGCLIGVVGYLLLPLAPSVPAWIGLRFLVGVGLSLPWLVGETWINSLSTAENRGRVVALYGAALFLGLAAGPSVVGYTGIEGWAPFLVAAGAVLLAMVPLALARKVAPPMHQQVSLGYRQAINHAPTVFTAALLAGFAEMGLYALLPLYVIRGGLDQDFSLLLLTVMTLGGLFMPYPIGWLADHYSKRLVLAVMGFWATLLVISLAFILDITWLVYLVGFLIGGLMLGFYTVGLALLGERFKLGDLAVANAAFILFYEAGASTGPVVSGFAMDLWDPYGLLLVVASGTGLFALLAVGRSLFKQDEKPEPL